MNRMVLKILPFLLTLSLILSASALSEPAPEYDDYDQSYDEAWDDDYERRRSSITLYSDVPGFNHMHHRTLP